MQVGRKNLSNMNKAERQESHGFHLLERIAFTVKESLNICRMQLL